MHALVPIRRHKCFTTTPGIVLLELAPRIVFLHDWLASFEAIPSDLEARRTVSTQGDLGEHKWE